jgi:hypothetical protein
LSGPLPDHLGIGVVAFSSVLILATVTAFGGATARLPLFETR